MSMLDKLMFWKQEEPDFNPHAPMNDPLTQHQDPLQQPPLGMPRDGGMPPYPMGQDPLQPGQGPMPDLATPRALQHLEEVHPSSAPPAMGPPSGGSVEKELEILSAKVDALRASVESMNQRIINIEAIAKESQGKQQARW